MKKRLQMLLIIVVLAYMVNGCGFIGSETENGMKDETIPPVQQETEDKGPDLQQDETKNDQIEDSVPKIETNVSFKEAFPSDAVFGKPEEFLRNIIPGFQLKWSQEDVERTLGKPDSVQTVQYDWGKQVSWIYQNLAGYQLTLLYDEQGEAVNFQLTKYFKAKGSIPKVRNKSVPKEGDPIGYSELGFEEILLGSTIDEMISGFGDPMESYITYDEMYGYDLVLIYQGVNVHMLIEEGENPYVHLIETNDYAVVETYRGIHAGSTVDEVIKQYGKPSYDWQETGDIIYATEDYWFAIKFIIENEKVKSILIYEAS